MVALGVTAVPAPRPASRPAKETPRRPIEAAYEQIRIGMGEEDLYKLMAPFRQMFTGHAQWPAWTDGQFEVVVTVWPGGDILEGILAGRPFKVQEKALSKKGADGAEKRLARARGGSS